MPRVLANLNELLGFQIPGEFLHQIWEARPSDDHWFRLGCNLHFRSAVPKYLPRRLIGKPHNDNALQFSTVFPEDNVWKDRSAQSRVEDFRDDFTQVLDTPDQFVSIALA